MPKLAPETQSAKRTQILDAAERCFARAGFHRATMHDICKEAGVSPGALYTYFSSKEDLISGWCERECANAAQMIADTAAASDLVAALTGLAQECPILKSPDKLQLHADIAAEAIRNPAIADMARASDASIFRTFEVLLTQARDEGRIAPECEIAVITRLFAMIGDGLFLHCAQNPDFDPQSVQPAFEVIVKALLNPQSHAETAPEAGPEKRSPDMTRTISTVLAGALAMGGLLWGGSCAYGQSAEASAPPSAAQSSAALQTPAVTVVAAHYASFTDTVMVTGSLAPREEVLVGPEIEGLRIIELLVEEGDEVKQGQVLARLSRDTIEAQLAQNSAGVARANASIEQAKLLIAEAEAMEAQASADFERTEKLRQSGTASVAVFDQRQAAALSSKAKLGSTRRGLALAEADKAQLQAQRRELEIRVGHTDIKAPAAGVVSRRAARLGAQAAGAGEPLFRIISKGEIELDAEAAEAHLPKLKAGMKAKVQVVGLGERRGSIRRVMPEVDKGTRLGRVRIFLGADHSLHIGSFATGVVEVDSNKGIAVPAGAVLYGPDGALVQVVRGDRVETRPVTTGLSSGDTMEIRSGLAEGEMVVARAGAFLRDGDAVRPVAEGQTALSETGTSAKSAPR